MDMTFAASGIVVAVASLVAAVTDVWKFKVYNVLTIPLLMSGLIYSAFFQGWMGFSQSLYGALFGFGILIIPYAFGGIGAGDVKFLTGIGAWVGIPMMYVVALVGFLATGIYAVGVAVVHRRGKETCVNLKIMMYRILTIGHYLRAGDEIESVQEIAQQEDRRSRLVPFSAMMGVGAVLSLLLQMVAG